MRKREEIEAELRALQAGKLSTGQGSQLESWVNGAIFALCWAAGEFGAISPSDGFSRWLEARPQDRAPRAGRSDPAIPG